MIAHHLLTALPYLPLPAPAPAPAVPNPGPVVVPGLATPLNTVIGWGKWLAIIAGVIGLIACGVMMMVGRRNRHSFAADGAAGIPWVLGGLALVAISSGIVGVFLS
jgi:type IV secretory pathway VirB2 component (pilin)